MANAQQSGFNNVRRGTRDNTNSFMFSHYRDHYLEVPNELRTVLNGLSLQNSQKPILLVSQAIRQEMEQFTRWDRIPRREINREPERSGIIVGKKYKLPNGTVVQVAERFMNSQTGIVGQCSPEIALTAYHLERENFVTRHNGRNDFSFIVGWMHTHPQYDYRFVTENLDIPTHTTAVNDYNKDLFGVVYQPSRLLKSGITGLPANIAQTRTDQGLYGIMVDDFDTRNPKIYDIAKNGNSQTLDQYLRTREGRQNTRNKTPLPMLTEIEQPQIGRINFRPRATEKIRVLDKPKFTFNIKPAIKQAQLKKAHEEMTKVQKLTTMPKAKTSMGKQNSIIDLISKLEPKIVDDDERLETPEIQPEGQESKIEYRQQNIINSDGTPDTKEVVKFDDDYNLLDIRNPDGSTVVMKVHKNLRIRYRRHDEEIDPDKKLLNQETYKDEDGNTRRRVKIDGDNRTHQVFEIKNTDGETVVKPTYKQGFDIKATSFITSQQKTDTAMVSYRHGR